MGRPIGPSRWVKDRRADLTRVRDAEQLWQLVVEGPGVASLAGLERMTALESLHLERLAAPDLTPMRSLQRVEWLLISDLRDPVDFSPITALTNLRTLQVNGCTESQGARIATLHFRALSHLKHLFLICTDEDARVPLRLDWLEPGSAIRRLDLNGFVFPDEDTERVCALADQLEEVFFTPASPAQRDRLYEVLKPRRIGVWAYEVSTFEVLEPEEYRHRDGRSTYYVVIDVAERRGLETTLDALTRAERLLQRHRPDLLDALTMETSSEGVWLSADSPEPLEAARDVLLADTPR